MVHYRRTHCLLPLGRQAEAMHSIMEALNLIDNKRLKDELTKIFVNLLRQDKEDRKDKQKNLYEILGISMMRHSMRSRRHTGSWRSSTTQTRIQIRWRTNYLL